MDFIFIFNTLLLALGFGFVIFWHELGHFLAAKWAGVRVEQFAVGFGNAIVSFRKGLGIRFGTSGPEYQQLKQDDPARAATMSPTEYRLNWLPLGGYVKMHGQEDMIASTTSTDTDHYMNKSVGKRMVIISAGVVMNVILAAILFTAVYFIGFSAPAPVVGAVVQGAPAEKAGIQVGDRIIAINDEPQYAWTNIALKTALLQPNVPANFTIQPAGTGDDPSARKTLQIIPSSDAGQMGMVGVGIGGSPSLEAVGPEVVIESEETLRQVLPPDDFAVRPGEAIVAVAGQAVDADDYYVLHRALEASDGTPVPITVRTVEGATEQREVRPRLLAVGGEGEEASDGFAGLLPLVEVLQLQTESPNVGKLLPGDVIETVTVSGTADTLSRPSLTEMKAQFAAAGRAGRQVDVVVRRGTERVTLEKLELTVIDRATEQYGLGFVPTVPTDGTTLGGVKPQTPAARAGVPTRGQVAAVAGQPVANWFDVYRRLEQAAVDGAQAISITVEHNGEASQYDLPLTEADREAIVAEPVVASLYFVMTNQLETLRQTRNPLQAMWWGVLETKDQILKLYLTLKRVAIDQTVSPKNLTGPVGIIHFGTLIAQRGYDWLLWFLAMISANLAVVNFLPVPILDGGHMVFLASEKLRGKPPSPRVQTAALYAGLMMILGLVLFVTYNDLQRMLFM